MTPSTRRASGFRLRHRTIPGPPADPVKARLLRLHVALARRFGPQRWWPGRTPFEIAAGAILASTRRGRARRGRSPPCAGRGSSTRAGSPPSTRPALAELIRPRRDVPREGAPAPRVRALAARSAPAAAVSACGRRRSARCARELLAVAGLGPETVDAILLYAAGRPVFVADAYTRRVLARHRLILPPTADYEEARAFLEAHLPSDPALFNELHALLVAAGKAHCRTAPRCEACPLQSRSRRPAARSVSRAHRPQLTGRRPGAGDRERSVASGTARLARALAHLLERRRHREQGADALEQRLGAQRRLREHRGAAGALDEAGVRHLLAAARRPASGCRAPGSRAGSTR